jgi:hypothetical protein
MKRPYGRLWLKIRKKGQFVRDNLETVAEWLRVCGAQADRATNPQVDYRTEPWISIPPQLADLLAAHMISLMPPGRGRVPDQSTLDVVDLIEQGTPPSEAARIGAWLEDAIHTVMAKEEGLPEESVPELTDEELLRQRASKYIGSRKTKPPKSPDPKSAQPAPPAPKSPPRKP